MEVVTTSAELAFKRLKADLDAVGVSCCVGPSETNYYGSGRVYVEFTDGTESWDSPMHTSKHRTLFVNVFADCDRDSEGRRVRLNERAKAEAVFQFCDKYLNNKTSNDWPEVISCVRSDGPIFTSVPDSNRETILITSVYQVAVL